VPQPRAGQLLLPLPLMTTAIGLSLLFISSSVPEFLAPGTWRPWMQILQLSSCKELLRIK
jgi:hypothetical protein